MYTFYELMTKVQILRILMKKLIKTLKRPIVYPFLTLEMKREKRNLPSWLFTLIRYKSHHAKNKGKRYYNKEIGIIYVNFLKALFHNELNLERSKFKSYADILEYLQKFSKDITFSKNYISQLKTRGGKFEKVSLSPQSLDFVKYVIKTYPDFKVSEFIHYPSEISVNITEDISKGMELLLNKSKPKRAGLKEGVSSSAVKETKLLDISSYVVAYFFILIPYFGLMSLYLILEGCFAPLGILAKECTTFKDDLVITPDLCAHKFTVSLFNEMQLPEVGLFWDTEDLEPDSTVAPHEIYPKTDVGYIAYPLCGEAAQQATTELSAQGTTMNNNSFSSGSGLQSSTASYKKNNFYSFFSMLDFNNMACYPVLSQDYSLSDIINNRYKFSLHTTSFRPEGPVVKFPSLRTEYTHYLNNARTYLEQLWTFSEGYPSDQGSEAAQGVKATNKLTSESSNTSTPISDIISFKGPINIDPVIIDSPLTPSSNNKNYTLNLDTEVTASGQQAKALHKNNFKGSLRNPSPVSYYIKDATSKEWYLNYIAETIWHDIISNNISNKNSFTHVNNIKNYSLDCLINKSANKQINISVTDFFRILRNFSSINNENLKLMNLVLTENYVDSYYNSNTSLINPSRSEDHVSLFIKNNLTLNTSTPSSNYNDLNRINNLLLHSSSPVISQASPLCKVSPLITDDNPMPNQHTISDVVKWRSEIWKSRNRTFD